MKSMKDPTYPTPPRRYNELVVVPRAKNEGPSVSTEPSDARRDDVGVSVDLESVWHIFGAYTPIHYINC